MLIINILHIAYNPIIRDHDKVLLLCFIRDGPGHGSVKTSAGHEMKRN